MDNASKATLSQQSRLLEVLHKHCPEYYDYNDSRMWDFTETLTKRHASELITEYYDGKVDRLKAEFYQFIKERKEQWTK